MPRAFEAYREDSWVLPYLRKYGKVFFLAVALSVVAYVFAAALMFTSGYMISLAATIPFTVLALHVPSIFVRIFGIGKPIIQYFERLTSHDWVLKASSHLRRRVYDAVEKDGDKRSLGSMLGVFASDIENVQDIYLRSLLPMCAGVLVYAIVVVALGVFSVPMGLLALVALGLACVVVPLWAVAINGASVVKQKALEKDMYDHLVDDVVGISDWRLSGRRDDFMGMLECGYERAFEQRRAISRRSRLLSLARQGIYALFVVAIVIWACLVFGSSIENGILASGATKWLGTVAMHDSVPYAANWIAAFVLCAFPLIEVFTPLDEAALGLVSNATAVKDLNDLDSNDDEAGCNESRTGAGRKSFDKDRLGRRIEESPCEGKPAVELSGVGFSYDGATVLSGLDLFVSPGEKIAVIGRSGAGKSTLLKIIFGELSPDEGSVAVRGKVAFVEQFPYIFNKALRENMLLAKPAATDDEILYALHAVGLEDLLRRLPDGLDAMMAEGGVTLSGGERHRVALARVLLSSSDIVLLDEPYLGLDAQTESEVSQNMMEAFADKTVILVTHHTRDLDPYDRTIKLGS